MHTPARTCDQDYAALVRGHYGPTSVPGSAISRAAPEAGRRARSTVLSADTGVDVLDPAPLDAPVEEYVVDRPEPPADAVVAPADVLVPPSEAAPARDPAAPSRPDGRPPAPHAEPPAAPATRQAEQAPSPAASSSGATARPDRGSSASFEGHHGEGAPSQSPSSPSPPAAPAAAGLAPAQEDGRRASLTEDDLAADMQAILSGQKVYDPQTKKVRPPGGGALPPAEPPVAPERPAPQARNDQAIFDRIAQSMEHANSFDLGTVELSRRFGGFDQAHERRRTPPSTSRPAPPTPPPATPRQIGTAAFVEDLSAMAQHSTPLSREELRSAYGSQGPWTGIPGRHSACGASSLALTLAPERSTAMYDTGEHVLAAGDLYPDRLIVGASPGVAFSYGQIVAMPDFYESVEALLTAPSAELSRLKALIERNTEYYRDNRRDASKDVSHDKWDEATGGRYLRLADVNYAHFSPASLLGMSGGGQEATNRSRWEELHGRAIREMQELVLAHRDSTPFPNGPLITNAFADHFLTDAFAAGHAINKEAVIERFSSRFFTGGDLNAGARTFFDQVARRAYTGPVAARFSQLEPTQLPLCAGGFCLPIRPNIRTAGMFAEVLKQAAEAEPVKIANLAVKIIHDTLNRDGLEVVNDAGDPAWRVTGDGSMNPTSLAIMRRAVQQSVDNLNDPAILVTNLDTAPFLARVWRHVPRPTSAAVAEATRVVDTYTDPRNADFVRATADLITQQLDALVKALLDSGRMQED